MSDTLNIDVGSVRTNRRKTREHEREIAYLKGEIYNLEETLDLIFAHAKCNKPVLVHKNGEVVRLVRPDRETKQMVAKQAATIEQIDKELKDIRQIAEEQAQTIQKLQGLNKLAASILRNVRNMDLPEPQGRGIRDRIRSWFQSNEDN